jgi:hypothetical protein
MQSTSTRLFCRAPRAYLFTQAVSTRSFSAKRLAAASQPTPFNSPSPPRLPQEEQELFELLQRESTGAFSTPHSPPKINQSPNASTADVAKADDVISDQVEKVAEPSTSNFEIEFKKAIEARGQGEELHPNARRGAPPEFEGDVNPKTGEVGGPKNEPLRWGAAGEWSYNGRTTDF